MGKYVLISLNSNVVCRLRHFVVQHVCKDICCKKLNVGPVMIMNWWCNLPFTTSLLWSPQAQHILPFPCLLALQHITSRSPSDPFSFIQTADLSGFAGWASGSPLPAAGHRKGPVQLDKGGQTYSQVKDLLHRLSRLLILLNSTDLLRYLMMFCSFTC